MHEGSRIVVEVFRSRSSAIKSVAERFHRRELAEVAAYDDLCTTKRLGEVHFGGLHHSAQPREEDVLHHRDFIDDEDVRARKALVEHRPTEDHSLQLMHWPLTHGVIFQAKNTVQSGAAHALSSFACRNSDTKTLVVVP